MTHNKREQFNIKKFNIIKENFNKIGRKIINEFISEYIKGGYHIFQGLKIEIQ